MRFVPPPTIDYNPFLFPLTKHSIRAEWTDCWMRKVKWNGMKTAIYETDDRMIRFETHYTKQFFVETWLKIQTWNRMIVCVHFFISHCNGRRKSYNLCMWWVDRNMSSSMWVVSGCLLLPWLSVCVIQLQTNCCWKLTQIAFELMKKFTIDTKVIHNYTYNKIQNMIPCTVHTVHMRNVIKTQKLKNSKAQNQTMHMKFNWNIYHLLKCDCLYGDKWLSVCFRMN